MGARKEERKKKNTAEKVPNRGGHLSLNVENVKDEEKKKKKGSRLGKDEKVQVIQGNFPCL